MKTPNARKKVEIVYKIECHAPQDVFLENEADIPAELSAYMFKHCAMGLNCDGGGIPGMWCDGCPFATIETEEWDTD
jgi:hypothetical protein